MNRKAAEGMIGERVSAWTALRGCYRGILVEVKPTRPWRGVVKVEQVEALPQGNKAFLVKEGELLEVGATSIQFVHNFEHWTYKDTLILLLHKEKTKLNQWEKAATDTPRAYHPMSPKLIKERREALEKFL